MERRKVTIEPSNLHECIKGEEFQEMTKEFKGLSNKVGGLCTDIALVKRDVSDLKTVTVSMSECIKALTESSIKAGENNITRDQFYSKIDELTRTRQALIDTLKQDLIDYKEEVDARLDGLDLKIADINTTVIDYQSLKKWIWGIVAAIVIVVLLDLYRVLITHAI